MRKIVGFKYKCYNHKRKMLMAVEIQKNMERKNEETKERKKYFVEENILILKTLNYDFV